MNVLLKTGKVLLVGLLVLLLAGIARESQQNVDFDDLALNVSEQLEPEKMRQGDELLLRRLYGLNGEELEHWILYTARDNMDVEELLLLEVKDEEQIDEAYKAVEKRIEIQKKNFEGYGPEQLQLIEKNVLRAEGIYMLFVISENSEAVKAAFLRSL